MSVPGLELEALPNPVLEAAEHLLDLVAEFGERECGTRRAVATGAPAVGDHGHGRVEKVPGLFGDEGGRQMDGAGYVPLVPGGGGARVEEYEAGVAVGRERGLDVGDIGVKGERGTEAGGRRGREAGGTRRTGLAAVVGCVVMLRNLWSAPLPRKMRSPAQLLILR